MRNSSTNMVYELVRKDKRVLAVTADNRNEVFNDIRINYPAQYIEYGIAEENMIASCAGLSTCGFIPFLYTITNFMSMHAFEYIRNDVCIGNRNVKFLGRSSGLASSSMGATHQGTEELALLRALPNIITITPASPIEAREATKFAYNHYGPVYIRLEGYNEKELFGNEYQFTLGKGCILREGCDVSLFAMGSIVNEALEAAEYLSKNCSVEIEIINLPTVNPIDIDLIIGSLEKTKSAVSLEEHCIHGGLGTVIAEVIAAYGISARLVFMGLEGCAHGCGNRKDVREINHIASIDIINVCKQLYQEKAK